MGRVEKYGLCNTFAVAVGDKPLSLNEGESLEREP